MLNQAKNVFLVGIKGVAMANLALILKRMGKHVYGSDVEEEFITDESLKKNKIPFGIGFNERNIPLDTDLVVYSAAHQGDKNPQIVAAKKNGIAVISQAKLLGALAQRFKTTLAVCGCHGKTTTSSLLAYSLIKLGVKPSYMIGSSAFNGHPGGAYDSNDYFVVEADEYGVNPPYDITPKFHFLDPDYILCTNIDFDHPDVYKDIESVKKSFLKFFKKDAISYPRGSKIVNKKLILCADDKNLMDVARQLNKSAYLTYGFTETADLRIVKYQAEVSGSSFQLQMNENRHSGVALFSRMTIQLFGEKNISNTAGVILLLIELGVAPEKIRKAIRDFTGAKRRFEKIYSKDGTFLFDDYAHHPKEIEATIQAARKRFPKKRIIIIFQPHTYSRTQALYDDFAKSLSLADLAFILPIFPSARENPKNFKIRSYDIANQNPQKLIYVDSNTKLTKYLISNIKYQDIIFTMGAGDVYKLKNDIIEIISKI